jgi:chromate transporter
MTGEGSKLFDIAKLFLKLGSISFGGPAAHISMMENEVVRKRQWMTHEHFLDLIGATNLIPGPNSTEMSMHCGQERAGYIGLIIAGISFILPAVIVTAVFAWLYQRYGHLPKIELFIYGIKPAVIAIIISAVISLGRKALKNIEVGILGVATLVACLFGMNEIVALFACGFMGLLLYFIKRGYKNVNVFFPLFLLQIPADILREGNGKIFWIFLKIGALLYGGGYVLFGFLNSELVAKGLLSRQILIDAVAVGQFTPGPVLSAATFIGWQMNGITGALAATAGIFLPSFLFVALLNPLIPRLRKSKVMSAFLDSINIAAVAIIAAVCIAMGKDTLTDWRTMLIGIISLAVILLFKKLNNAFIVLGGSAMGYLLMLL